MTHLHHIEFLYGDDTEIQVSGTVKKNPYFTNNIFAAHYSPDEEPHDIEIKTDLPDTLTSSEIEEIKEQLFEAHNESFEPYEI